MDIGIRGKVAMVAAGSRGLGYAGARALAQEGCAVSICGRGAEALEAARHALEALSVPVLALQADVTRKEDLRRWFQATEASLGPVDILVTNTGGPKAAGFDGLSDADWEAGVQGTLLNAVRLCRLALPGMRARRWGRIVHLTSLVARQPLPLLTISSTLRAGLSALTKTLAQETAAEGVTVNAVLPGHILTDRQRQLGSLRAEAEGISLEEALARTAATIPARRLGRAEEVGDLVAFLCSARAAYLTGQSILVDGGLVGGLP